MLIEVREKAHPARLVTESSGIMLGGMSQESKNVQVSKKQGDAGARSLRRWIGLQVSA